MRYARSLAVLCVAAILAACGGGGGTIPGTGNRGGGAAAGKHGSAIFAIRVPEKAKRHGRSGRFVSPSTLSMNVNLNGPTLVNQNVSLVPGSPNCVPTLGAHVCSYAFDLAPGSYTASLTAYDNPTPGLGNVLSITSNVAFSIVAGAVNAVHLTLAGVPAQIVVRPATRSSAVGVLGTIDLFGTAAHAISVQAIDADGNQIVGPGAPKFTIAQTGGALPLTVATPAPATPNQFGVTPPASYAAGSATLTVTASFAGQPTNACLAASAACTATVAFDMMPLVAAVSNNKATIYEGGLLNAYATVTLDVNQPSALAFDPAGDLVVASCLRGCGNGSSLDSVNVYAPPYNGLPVQITSGVSGPVSLAFDASGDLFVGNCGSCNLGGTDGVAEYKPPFTSASSPAVLTTSGVADPRALALDASNDLFVLNCFSCTSGGADAVTEYASPYGGSAAATIASGQLNSPNALALDSSADVFVSSFNNNTIYEYAPPYTILKAAITTGVNSPSSIALDAAGDLFVGENGGNNKVQQYTPPFSALSAPALTISTNVHNPGAVAVDPLANLYVANSGGNGVGLFTSPYAGAPSTLAGQGTATALAVLP